LRQTDGVKDMRHPDLMNSRVDHAAEYTCRPRLAAEARDAASAFLAGLDPAPPAHTAQTVLLLVSELVTNALRHAGEVRALRLGAGPRALRVTVEDPSGDRPRLRRPDLTGRSGGFGWHMIQNLADTVAVLPVPDGGKAVRVTVGL
jgi:anti-sigma regulatory factor (Ser/Thr protein kinase)